MPFVRRIVLSCIAALAIPAGVAAKAQEKPLHKFLPIDDKSNVSLAYVWLDIAEEATAREVDLNGARPTVGSRTLAIWATAMFDAWAAYDEKAVGSRLRGDVPHALGLRRIHRLVGRVVAELLHLFGEIVLRFGVPEEQ